MLGRMEKQQGQGKDGMKTALIVIDMQNSFLHPDGEHFYAEAPSVVPNCLALIERARKCRTLVVHVVERHRDGFEDFEDKHLPAHCVGGGFDSGYYSGFGPGAGAREIEIVKRRFSAFFATDLALFLHEQSVVRLAICGVKTNVCVRATVQDAFAHGFMVRVVRDATNSNQWQLADASLEDFGRNFGRQVSTSGAMELLE